MATVLQRKNSVTGMSSYNDAWRILRTAVWMVVKNYNNLADADNLLNQQQNNDLHIASGKCFILLLTAIQTAEKSRLEMALAEFKRLETRCLENTMTGGWMTTVRRKLFSTSAPGIDDFNRQIVLADVTICIAGLTMTVHSDNPSVGTVTRAVFALRRAWKMYQHSYTTLLDVYRKIYDLDPDQIPRWPPVLKRRQSTTSSWVSGNIGSRILRSATTSFDFLRQNSAPNIMHNDIVRLMAAASVGYGAFNLIVSLLPPTIVSVSGMFGFRGNRQTGLDALTFAKNGPDVHAPLAWGLLSWYRMIGNTDFLFDGPQSRENESYINESEQLVLNPPKEFRNSTVLQYFTGRSSFLKGDIEGSIRAFEDGSTNVEYYFVDMDIMCLHELGFMYALKMDWMAACRTFSNLAEDNSWIRPYHYFMATVCAGAAGDKDTGETMWRLADKTGNNLKHSSELCYNLVCESLLARKQTVANALQLMTGNNECGGTRHCRMVVYEILYVKYGVAKWPTDTLNAILADCREMENDDDTTRLTKKLLTTVCRRALNTFVDGYRQSLAEIVEYMERNKRRDHLYAYGLYELAAEQIGCVETIDEGKRTIQKLTNLKGPYYFQNFYDKRCASLQAYVQKLNVR